MSGLAPSAIGAEVWMAAGYSVVVVGLAYVIDGFARRAAAASEGGSAGGFSYHADHDAWTCPEDQWLWPQSFDPDNRVMRYRGTPSICNACPVKETCTTSHAGREMQRAVDSWPASEAARFHRGIACTLAALGLIWPLAIAVTAPGIDALLVLAAGVLAALLLSLPLWSHLRRTPAFVPEGVAHQSLDEVVDRRDAASAALARRRSRYLSDHVRPDESTTR